jgi:phosphomannomutase
LSVPLPADLMVSVSGFRGRVGSALTPELVAALAAAYGAFLQADGAGNRVLLGRDSRTSGRMFAQSAIAGLQSVGSDVVDLGIVPTPTLMLAVEDAGAAGGIGVTASHNPAEWNALKFAAGDGSFLDPARMARFQASLEDAAIPRASWDALGSLEHDEGAIARHLERILALSVLDVGGLRKRRFKVALDCVRGAGGLMMPELLERLGCEVVATGLEVDGRFPRDPEPTAANLGELRELVCRSGADVGFAVDPDVDRLSLVAGDGEALGEDFTLALASAVVLRRTPGVVVTNLSTSRIVEDVAAAFRSPVVRAPVGEINVSDRMRVEEAVVGGEGNGGVILPELHLTRDAPVGAALILQYLLDEAVPLREAVARLPSYTIVKEKLAFPREAIREAYRRIEEEMDGADVNRDDGLRLAWPDERKWLHVRPSGTEPVVRLIAEAPEEDRARLLLQRAGACMETVR